MRNWGGAGGGNVEFVMRNWGGASFGFGDGVEMGDGKLALQLLGE